MRRVRFKMSETCKYKQIMHPTKITIFRWRESYPKQETYVYWRSTEDRYRFVAYMLWTCGYRINDGWPITVQNDLHKWSKRWKGSSSRLCSEDGLLAHMAVVRRRNSVRNSPPEERRTTDDSTSSTQRENARGTKRTAAEDRSWTSMTRGVSVVDTGSWAASRHSRKTISGKRGRKKRLIP